MIKMVDNEQTCFFHWTQFLDKHTKQLIAPKFKQLIAQNFHDQQKTLCYEYKKATSLEEANIQYATIRSWWYSFGAANKGDIHELNNWCGFWYFCV